MFDDPDWLVLVAAGVANGTASGPNLAVEKRHDERLIASDNEVLASLIRHKHSIIVMDNCGFIRDRKSGGAGLLTIAVTRMDMSGRAGEGGEQPRISSSAQKKVTAALATC